MFCAILILTWNSRAPLTLSDCPLCINIVTLCQVKWIVLSLMPFSCVYRWFWHNQKHARPAAAGGEVEPFPADLIRNKIGWKGLCWFWLFLSAFVRTWHLMDKRHEKHNFFSPSHLLRNEMFSHFFIYSRFFIIKKKINLISVSGILDMLLGYVYLSQFVKRMNRIFSMFMCAVNSAWATAVGWRHSHHQYVLLFCH